MSSSPWLRREAASCMSWYVTFMLGIWCSLLLSVSAPTVAGTAARGQSGDQPGRRALGHFGLLTCALPLDFSYLRGRERHVVNLDLAGGALEPVGGLAVELCPPYCQVTRSGERGRVGSGALEHAVH